MNEDDTFRALQRMSFHEVRKIFIEDYLTGYRIESIEDFFKRYDWTYKEYLRLHKKLIK